MITLFFQSLTAVLVLSWGISAWSIARQVTRSPEAQRSAWLLTGLGFTLMGVNVVLHNAWAVWAFVSGPDTAVYSEFLRWSPAGNTSRNFLVLCYGTGLLVLPTAWRLLRTRSQALVVSAFLTAMVMGGVFGWLGGPLVISKHWSQEAILSSLIVLVLLGALFQSLFTHSMDRLLWLCMGIYALHEALNVIWLSALAWSAVPGVWRPHPAQVPMFGAAAFLVMLALAAHRRAESRRNVTVPALLEPLPERRFSAFG